MKRLNRRESRRLKQYGVDLELVNQDLQKAFQIKTFSPMTQNQKLVFNHSDQGKNILLHGVAGTGKSFISLYLALKKVMTPGSPYKKVNIVRSVVPTRDMGFLPGNNKEKAKVYEQPYMQICSELFGRGDAYEILKNKGILDFISTSFIRGSTLSDCILVVDEIQNMDFGELDSVITRVGNNCKTYFCGDFRQSDFRRDVERSGVHKFMSIIKGMNLFEFVEFNSSDIVRCELVKQYIIEKERLEIVT